MKPTNLIYGEKPRSLIELGPGVLFREGKDLLSKGQSAEALSYFRQVLRHSKRVGDQTNVAWSLYHIAMALRAQRQFDTALHLLEDAQTIFLTTDNDVGRASVLLDMSLANREMDRNTLALEYGHNALKTFESIGKSLDLGWAYDNLAAIHLNLFHRPESLMYAKKARALFLEFGSLVGLSWNACNLATLYLDMGFLPKAEQYFQEAVKVFTQLKDKQGMGWASLGLATVLRSECRYTASEEALARAREIFKELGLKDRQGWCLLNESAIKRSKGEAEEAILLNKRALQFFTPIRNNDGAGWALFQTGLLLRESGYNLKAWQSFREAMNLHSDVDNRKGLGWIENEMGRTYLELGDQSHARDCLVKAKVIAEHLDEIPLKVRVARNLAMLYTEEGSLQKAENILDETESACRKIQDHEVEVEVLLELVRHNLIVGDLNHARQILRQASGLIEVYHLHRLKGQAGLCLAEILIGEDRVEQAVRVWRDVIDFGTKGDYKVERSNALLGLCQIIAIHGLDGNIMPMLQQVEKDVRTFSSRKLKAKFLMTKAFVSYYESKEIDMKAFHQALQILSSSGLAVLERQALSAVSELYQEAGRIRERAECEAHIKSLLARSPVDLHLVIPRSRLFKSLPVSLVT